MAIYETGQRFGMQYTIDVLLGKESSRVLSLGHQKNSSFGSGAQDSKDDWQSLLRSAYPPWICES